MDPRLRAVIDLSVAEAREGTGRHEYDGLIQDLSPEGVDTALGRLGGPRLADPHDESHLSAFEISAQVTGCAPNAQAQSVDPPRESRARLL